MDVPNANVMTKDVNGDVDTLTKEAHKYFSGGKFDYIVVLPDDPVEAGINLNKIEGARCVTCSSEADAEKARSHNANMIIIENPDPDVFNSLIGSLVKKQGIFSSKPKHVAPKEREAPVEHHHKEEAHEERVHEARVQHHDEKASHEEHQEEMHRSSGKKKSISESIKDALGIMD